MAGDPKKPKSTGEKEGSKSANWEKSNMEISDGMRSSGLLARVLASVLDVRGVRASWVIDD